MNGCNEALTPVQVVHERFGSRALNPIRSKYDSEQAQLVEHIIALDYKIIMHCQCMKWAKLHYRLLGLGLDVLGPMPPNHASNSVGRLSNLL